MTIEIVKYNPEYERGWLHCRVLSFLETQYYNDVYQEKEAYENEAIELLALEDGKVVGLIDLELEKESEEICSSKDTTSAMLWHIAVHPDYQRKGIGELLLNEAIKELKNKGIRRIEAWTKEDDFVRKWYFKNDFRKFQSYYHVRLKGEALGLKGPVKGFQVLSGFGHYVGEDRDAISDISEKVEECVGLEKYIL